VPRHRVSPLLLAALLAGLLPLRAQDALPPQPPQPSRPVEAGEETIRSIQFPNSDVRSLLDFYEKLTNAKLVYDGTVQGQVNLVVNREVTRDEAVQLIETALLLNGFTLVPGPGEIIKVLGPSRNARQFGVPIVSEFEALPENDQIVSFLFKLEYADPTEVQQVLAPLVAPSSYTLFMPLPKSQAIVVTESSGVIRMLSRVIGELDKPPAEVVSEFIPLTRADATEVVEKLNVMFEQPGGVPSASQPAAPAPQPGPGGPPPGPGQPNTPASVTLSENSLIVGKIKLTADQRTNRVHVVTRPINMPFIRRLLEEYDSDIAYGEPMRRPLRFVKAGEILDVLVDSIQESGGVGTTAQTGGAAPRAATPVRTTQSTQQQQQVEGEELSAPDIDNVPEARAIGNAKLIADKRANAIIVLGNDAMKQKVMQLLDEIDIRSPQVMLTAVIGELLLNEGEEFGIDYIQSLGRETTTTINPEDGGVTVTRSATGFAGIARNTSVPVVDLRSLTSAASFAGVDGGVTAFIGVTKSLEMIVRALEGTGRFRITSRPMVFTSNNRKALIASGQQIAVPATTLTGVSTGDNLVNNTTIQYRDVNLKLEVVPLINSENEVTLEILQEVNSVSGSTVIGGNEVPTINTRRIKTSVSVANEATIVLGGLVQESKEDSRTSVPILGKIPLLGSLFSHKKKTVRRTELVVLLRPTVSSGPDDAVRHSEQAQEKFNFPPDLDSTIDPEGSRVDLMPVPMKEPELQPRTGK